MSVSDGSRGYLRGRLQLVFPPNYLYTDMKGGQMARRCREAWDGRTTSSLFLCFCALSIHALCFMLHYASYLPTGHPRQQIGRVMCRSAAGQRPVKGH